MNYSLSFPPPSPLSSSPASCSPQPSRTPSPAQCSYACAAEALLPCPLSPGAIRRCHFQLGMVVQPIVLAIWETEAGKFLEPRSLRMAWETQ